MRFGMFIEMLVNEIYLNALGRFTSNTLIYLTPSKYKLYIIHVWGHLSRYTPNTVLTNSSMI